MLKIENKKTIFLKGLIIVGFILIIIPLRTATAADLYTNIAPRFSKVSGYTSGPTTGSEPGNIFWKDKSPYSVESFYKNNGWRVAKGDTVSTKVDYFFFIPTRLYIRLDMASTIKAYVGGSLKTNWEGKTFIANSEYSTIYTFPFVSIQLPMKRDHFRIWDIGSDVLGVATYDNGIIGSLTTAIINILNDPLIYWAIYIISISNPIAAAAAITAILIAAGIFDLITGTFNAGHIIDHNNPWKTMVTARNTWYYYGSSYQYNTFDRCGTYSWSLTGHTTSWTGNAYQCYYSDGGGGGGCVAKDTDILLADGLKTKKVQSLKVGDWVLGYNTSSGETIPVQVTNITELIVPSLLNINDGLLKTTVVDQPIYMQNTTYTGWLNDPINLQIGDEIFNVPMQEWIKVGSLETEVGNRYKVYDVATDPLNVFIGNGILLDVPLKI